MLRWCIKNCSDLIVIQYIRSHYKPFKRLRKKDTEIFYLPQPKKSLYFRSKSRTIRNYQRGIIFLFYQGFYYF